MIRLAVFVLLLKFDLIFCDKANGHNANGIGHPINSGTPSINRNARQFQAQSSDGTLNPRYRRNSKDLSFLRLYLCEAGYQNCMPDESNEVPIQPDILSQISQMFKLPPNFMNGRELNLRNLNLSGQRERPVFADEPSYLLVQTDQSLPQPLALLSGPPTDLMDDPFIPQRGRRGMQIVHSGDQNKPMINLMEKLTKNGRPTERMNTIGHQHQRTLASNGYFLPMGHTKINIDGAAVDD